MIIPIKEQYYRQIFKLLKEFHYDFNINFNDFLNIMSKMNNNYGYIINNPNLCGYLFCNISKSFTHNTLIVNELVICIAPQILELFNKIINFLFQFAFLNKCTKIIIINHHSVGIDWFQFIEKNNFSSDIYNCILNII